MLSVLNDFIAATSQNLAAKSANHHGWTMLLNIQIILSSLFKFGSNLAQF